MMAPVSKEGGEERRGPLSLDDCRCPVCLEFFMEPVTLPCTHTFCKGCFLETVDKANLCCPMCRKRVSTWARLNSRNNTLVNQQLWSQIQTSFPGHYERRLTGQEDEGDLGVTLCSPTVSRPGELRQEYEDQISKLTEEKRVLDEEERRASEEYIQRLLAEEEEQLQEESRRREDDEKLARLLSNQLNSAAVSQENILPAAVSQSKKRNDVGTGQIEKFLCPFPSKSHHSGSSTTSIIKANKENILPSQEDLQLEYSPPELDYYSVSTNRSEPSDPYLNCVVDHTHKSQLIGDGGPSSTKRKSSELETKEEEEEEEVLNTKRGCHTLPPPSSSLFPSLEVKMSLNQQAEWEAEQLSRWQQEEEDRHFALLLQKELDREEKQRATDRRKGTADAYLLRQNRGGKVEASTSTSNRGPSKKSPKTSSSSPSLKSPKTSTSSPSLKSPKTSTSSPSLKSPSSSRGSKQTTLTEMFSSLTS